MNIKILPDINRTPLLVMGENNKLVYLKRGKEKLVNTKKRKGSAKCFMIYLLIVISLSIHDINSKRKGLFYLFFYNK